ncbi:hypothetical protein KUV57_11305 [Epibacterium sp. DP7N7-1]|nr:hypothetical protein [Epibacterium sp. DP7N7-1]
MPSWFLPHLFEWFLVLFQPMEDERLKSLLVRIGMPDGNGVLISLYLIFLFVISFLLRRAVVEMRTGYLEGEMRVPICIGVGFVTAGAVFFADILARIELFTETGEVLEIWGFAVPSFHVMHKALMPFDIGGINEMLQEGNFQRKLRNAFLFWQEDSRGLFVYPLMLLFTILPYVRHYTAPIVLGALMAIGLVPLVLGSFQFSTAAGAGICLVIFIFCGGLYALRRQVTKNG